MTVLTAPWPSDSLPQREDETAWPFALVAGDDPDSATILLSDSVTELVAQVIPGYPDDHDSALVARYQTAVATANDLQRAFVSESVRSDKLDLTDLDEDTLNLLLGNRAIPVDAETHLRWDGEPPLVLIATDYAPFTARTPIAGNVLWLDPSDEATFMRTLANVGVLEFFVHENA
ncbi:hypothetical protein [Aeromicrobium sp. CTD01-1L150]|uniref:hypothetical protein n=1 Tax=Aeromicrobium sp. CTD01-1L150 TaxID=3341830 RepID=UPI0035C01A1B